MRSFLVIVLVLMLVAQLADAATKPNVLIIVADDLGYADIGCQGVLKDLKTPNIDSIATNGVRFTNGYVSCPVCSPSRAGLLTGRYQERFGHEFNPGGNPPELFGLALDQVTIADALRKAGYTTGIVGKWHEGNRDGFWPTDRGFDSFFGFLGGAHTYTNNAELHGLKSIMRDKSPVSVPEYLTDAFSREAVDFIEKNHEKSFFLYLPYNAIHTPQEAPQKYQERFSEISDKHRRMALAMLSAEDDGVGRVLDKLREHHLEENTLIVFHSDNGGPTPANGSRNDPLSGYKGQVWEGGIRIPFLAQWKGKIPAGQVIDQPVIQLDDFATACAASGAQMPKDRVMDGVNLLPLMMGETKDRPHQILYWRFSPQWAIRDGDWKLVQFGKTPMQLFDLSKDVGEKRDLASSQPEVVKKLRAEFEEWDAQLMKPRWKNKPKFDEDAEGDARQEAHRGGKRGRRRAATTEPA